LVDLKDDGDQFQVLSTNVVDPGGVIDFECDDDNCAITFLSQAGATYTISSSTNLIIWTPVPGWTGLAGNGETL